MQLHRRLYTYIIDFLFPPSIEEMRLRSISPGEFYRASARANAPEFPFIISIFSYRDSLVRELIWQIKYRKNKYAVKCAAFALYKELNASKEPFLLVPIPLSRKRRNERGYNQCELIIDEILKLGHFSNDYSLLIRAKDIDKQTFKNKVERMENTKNIFEVTRSGKEKIIIIDDVSTTGSTLKEAREAFLKAGYKDISALTVAH